MAHNADDNIAARTLGATIPTISFDNESFLSIPPASLALALFSSAYRMTCNLLPVEILFWITRFAGNHMRADPLNGTRDDFTFIETRTL